LAKVINRLRLLEAQEPKKDEPAPTRQEQLLMEIRDILKSRPA
jgi:large-conductance mechanosensitive channel